MTDLPPLSLRTFLPDWEERWDLTNAKHEEMKAFALTDRFRCLPEARQHHLREEIDATGRRLGVLFLAQFRTTDDYRDWRLQWLDIHLRFRPEAGFQMPGGLPVAEIRHRIHEACGFRLFEPNIVRAPDHEMKVQALISAPPSAATQTLAYALARAGGDSA